MNIPVLVALSFTALFFIIICYVKLRSIDFYLGTGSYPAWISATSMVAAFIGGGAILNTSELAEKYGNWALADVFPSVLGLTVAVVLIFFNFFGKNFSKSFFSIDNKTYAALGVNFHYFQVAFLYILVIAAQFRGTSSFCEAIGIPAWLGVIISALIVALYSYRGFSAVTRTDVVQFFFLIPMYFVFLLFSFDPNISAPIPASPQVAMPWSLVIALSLPFFFLPISQEIHQRAASAKDDRTVLGSYIFAAFILLILGSSLVISFSHKPGLSVLSIIRGNNIVASIAVAVGVFAALLSTIDTAVNISAHAFQQLPKFRSIPPPLLQSSILVASAIIFNIFPSILSLILFAMFIYIAGPALTFIAVWLGVHPKKAIALSAFFFTSHAFIQFRLPAIISSNFPIFSSVASLLSDKVICGLLLILSQFVIIIVLTLVRRVR
jgi:hypothetical protein